MTKSAIASCVIMPAACITHPSRAVNCGAVSSAHQCAELGIPRHGAGTFLLFCAGFGLWLFRRRNRTHTRTQTLPYERLPWWSDFACGVWSVSGRINVGDLLPFGRQILMIRTVRKLSAYANNDFSIAAKGSEDAEDSADVTVVGHRVSLGSALYPTPHGEVRQVKISLS